MQLTGLPALLWFLISLAISVWTLYLFYRIAVHVEAWPFG